MLFRSSQEAGRGLDERLGRRSGELTQNKTQNMSTKKAPAKKTAASQAKDLKPKKDAKGGARKAGGEQQVD